MATEEETAEESKPALSSQDTKHSLYSQSTQSSQLSVGYESDIDTKPAPKPVPNEALKTKKRKRCDDEDGFNPKKKRKFTESDGDKNDSESDESNDAPRKLKRKTEDDKGDSHPKKERKGCTHSSEEEMSNEESDDDWSKVIPTDAIRHQNECKKCKHICLNQSNMLVFADIDADEEFRAHHARSRVKKKENNDWKLNPKLLRKAIIAICKELGIKIQIPTIDCFASVQNHHDFFYYITQKEDFFSDQYDCCDLWKYLIAWCNPPFTTEIMIKAIEFFQKRKIKGFLCGPYYKDFKNQHKNKWFDVAERLAVHCKNIGGLNKKNVYFPAFTGNKAAFNKCPFDTMICYFDCSDAGSNPSKDDTATYVDKKND